MPQPALTVFLIIAAIAIVVVLIAVIVIALRAQRRRKLAQTLEKRRDDEVQYAFIVNPSKPQAEARRLHIQRFCEAKGLNRIRFYDTQLDKDGRVCALEALEDGPAAAATNTIIWSRSEATARCARWRAPSPAPAMRWASSPSAPATCLPAIWAFPWTISTPR